MSQTKTIIEVAADLPRFGNQRKGHTHVVKVTNKARVIFRSRTANCVGVYHLTDGKAYLAKDTTSKFMLYTAEEFAIPSDVAAQLREIALNSPVIEGYEEQAAKVRAKVRNS
jgi:hypothetical protein